MKKILFILYIALVVIACKEKKQVTPPEEEIVLTATEIMEKAHENAGGDFWKRPKSLVMKGYGIFYEDGKPVKNEVHNMWRVYEDSKSNAHKANGKVRIESFRNGKPLFMVTYDGKNTYDLNGKQEASKADNRWASSFGFGAIRHALDDGYELKKVADDTINDTPVYQIKVVDQNKGETFFGIEKTDFRIVKVAFDTPRGWHHRIYSEFFTKSKYSWVQPGKVQLFYNDKIANEIFWDDFDVNQNLPDNLFVLN